MINDYSRLSAILRRGQYACEKLSHISQLDDFTDEQTVGQWSALSSADPDEAARNLFRALTNSSLDDRRRIKGHAGRELVLTLVRLAWSPSSFRNAVFSLALLAEAENEMWTTNASEEFIARFQVFLGGTATPYIDRLTVLDELLKRNRPKMTGLVVKALAQVCNRQVVRMRSDPASDELPEIEWQAQKPAGAVPMR